MNPGLAKAPAAVAWIARKLQEAGHDTWAVGGAVRDALLGRPTGDWDFATHARPGEVQKIFRRTVALGVEHGTVGVLKDGVLYEVTTFRRDVETDGRHAVVSFAETIEDDLSRRDFTINAIAWHPLENRLLDPFGGMADMEGGVLRTVGRADERFREDYLRILRALRFAGLFGLEIESDTWASLVGLVGHVKSLSAERLRDELVKVLDADPEPGRALRLYADAGALAVLYPELVALASAPDRWALTLATVEALPRRRPMLRLAALLRDLPPAEVAALLVRLRFSNAQVDETAYLAKLPLLPGPGADDVDVRRWLSACGPGRLTALARLDLARALAERRLEKADRVDAVVESWRHAKRVRAARPPLAVGDLAIDGRGLIGIGLKPGPHFGRILDGLLAWVLEDPTRNRAEPLAERARQLADAERTRG